MSIAVGVVGARGYVGRELLALLATHPVLRPAYVSSRQLAGQPEPVTGLVHEDLDPAAVAARAADICVLALPNGVSTGFVAALDAAGTDPVILDLSGDHRFDAGWYYGLPELTRERAAGTRRITNPGCYATAMQLAIAPVADRLESTPVCFGVSGYSGAGTTPSPRNDPEVLADNLLPYALTGHLHEREVSHQLGRPVAFTPHVAGFFRGISMTVRMRLQHPPDRDELLARYGEFYAASPLIRVGADIPTIAAIRERHGAALGGFAVGDGGEVVVVAVLDNLLKGAATQALQNLNLACGLDELTGIPHD